MKVAKLKVYANPYTLIHRLQGDVDGVTWAGLLPLEPNGPSEHGQTTRYVGATVGDATLLKPEETLTVKGKTAVTAYAQHDVSYKYSVEPVEVPNTPYYQHAVFANDLTGHSALVAADEATARACGINSTQFVAPLEILEQLRLEAIKRFAATNTDITEQELLELLPSVFAVPAKAKTQPVKAPTGGNV